MKRVCILGSEGSQVNSPLIESFVKADNLRQNFAAILPIQEHESPVVNTSKFEESGSLRRQVFKIWTKRYAYWNEKG